MRRYCEHCEERVDAEVLDEFVLCPECGSNLGPADGSADIMF